MNKPLVADTGGLIRAIASKPDGSPAWPDHARELTTASVIIIPPLILAEVDYFLRDQRSAMRRLIADILNPITRYELEPLIPEDLVRAIEIDRKFAELELGLVDGSVAAVAERRAVHRILTIDHKDFSALRIGPKYKQALTLVP